MNIKALIEKRDALYEDAKKLVEGVEAETRAFNDEEKAEYERIFGEIRKLNDTIQKMQEFSQLELTEQRQVEDGKQESREVLEERAFEAYLRGKVLEERNAVNMTAGNNGAVIPTSIVNKIIEKVVEISPLFERATKYNVGGTITIPYYPKTGAGATKITMDYATEFTALTSTAGDFGSIQLTGFLAGALSKVSVSLINNSQFAIVPFVINQMAKTVAQWIEGQMIKGTANKIEGLSGHTADVTAAATTAVTSDELITLQDSIPDAYQGNAIWVMSRATRTAIRKLKDGQQNYLLNKDFTSKWGWTLLGKPVFVSDNMDDMAAGKTSILYLDPSGLAVKISENPEVQVLREKFADEHAVGVICWLEMDCKVENDEKVATLKMKAS